MTHIPGRISRVVRDEEFIVISIENVSGHLVDFRITGTDPDALWAAGEYWEALKEHGEQLRVDIEDEMRELGIWKDDDED